MQEYDRKWFRLDQFSGEIKSHRDKPGARDTNGEIARVSRRVGIQFRTMEGADTSRASVRNIEFRDLKCSHIAARNAQIALRPSALRESVDVAILFVQRGSMQVVADGTTHTVVAGSACYLARSSRPRQIHTDSASSDFLLVNLANDPLLPDGGDDYVPSIRLRETSPMLVMAFGALHGLLHQDLSSQTSTEDDLDAFGNVLRSLMYVIAKHFIAAGENREQRVRRRSDDLVLRESRKVIRYHHCDPQFTVKSLARTMGMSVRSLQVAFAESGTTPTKEIRRARAASAAELLRYSPDMDTASVAGAVGLRSRSSLRALIQDFYSCAPGALRAGFEQPEVISLTERLDSPYGSVVESFAP